MGRGGDGAVQPGAVRQRLVQAAAKGSLSLDTTLKSEARLLDWKTVQQHNTPDDCWVVIKGKVYDVSGWGLEHPGGAVVYTYGGKDATDVFSAFHSPAAWLSLRGRLVGETNPETPELLQDFRAMRTEMQAVGMFQSSKLYYAYKSASNVAIGILSLAMLRYSSSWTSVFFASWVMALCWQQCGWLAHDFLHHQVFTNRSINNACGLFFGNFCQGFSVAWWKDKHNLHHAAPNELTHGHVAIDPDIDTLPMLAWSADMLKTLDESQRSLVRVQHWILLPILLFARLSWCVQSAFFPLKRAKELGHAKAMAEAALLAVHYAWLLGASFTYLSPVKAVAFITLSELFCGVLLGFVFIQSHNGMEVYNDNRDFVSSQLASTRNVHGNLLNDWFTGGLNRQIEHHLFPTLPRHNLGKAQKLIRAFCSKHGLYYENCSMTAATTRVLLRLVEVARVA